MSSSQKRYESQGWSEKRVLYALYDRYRDSSRFFTRNKYIFQPPKGVTKWESDGYMCTKSNVHKEFEVKVTSSDTQKEILHKKKKHSFIQEVWESEGECLRNPKYNPDRKNSKEFLYSCPNHFIFCCQEGLITEDWCREHFPYASLQYVTEDHKVKTIIRNKVHSIKQNLDDVLIHKFFNNSEKHDYAAYLLARDYKSMDKPTVAGMKKLIEKFVSDVSLRYI